MPVPVAAEADKGAAQPEGVTAAEEDHDWVLGDSEDPADPELVSDGLTEDFCLLAALMLRIFVTQW